MKKVYLILAATVGMTLASCTTNDYVGDETNVTTAVDDGSIKFGFDVQNSTRADIAGASAATLLGNNFYVAGTKGTEAAGNPSPNIVFDNYLVHFETNTAGKTESNTANWEYVGITPGTAPVADYPKLSPASITAQTIKYWDYSTAQYDFLAFSTGTYKPVTGTPTTSQIGVTAMKYGAGLAGSTVAYTFTLPNVDALKQTYVTDIVKVTKANYGKEVTLRFKNLGSKVRMGIYETIPGYAVKDVQFYDWDGTTDITAGSGKTKDDKAKLISGNSGGLPTNGTIQVIFPHVGTGNASQADYNKVAGHVTPGSEHEAYHGFGTLDNFASSKEGAEPDDNYLGRTLPEATFAGSKDANYYDVMFPITSTAPLTLRVDFTLVSVDGVTPAEEIHVYGAKAVVPSTYLNWLPNYAYTYIFKISDNTNGWTSTATAGTDADPAGLFPITFDAVVAEATDATGEQTTVTTVATPSITTYQQNHKKTETYPDEYKGAGSSTAKNIYVQVMNNSTVPATLVSDLSDTNSLLYKVDNAHAATATEALVMDALQQRTTAIDVANVTGRNSLTLTKNSYISNEVDKIENGADDQPIDLRNKNASGDPIDGSGHGKAAKITIGSLAAGTYAYVYDYTSGAKTTVDEYQPFTPGAKISAGYKKITTTTLNGLSVTTSDEIITDAIYKDYIYFSKTTNGTGTTTYSYISLAGKKGTTMPAGVVKVAKSTLGTTVDDEDTDSSTFYFASYISNNGKYAVKVIKIVA